MQNSGRQKEQAGADRNNLVTRHGDRGGAGDRKLEKPAEPSWTGWGTHCLIWDANWAGRHHRNQGEEQSASLFWRCLVSVTETQERIRQSLGNQTQVGRVRKEKRRREGRVAVTIRVQPGTV